jgi:hypothetical protein
MSCQLVFEDVNEVHIAGCLDCQAIANAVASSAPNLDALKSEALKELAQHPKATSWTRSALVLLGVLLAVVVAALLVLSIRFEQHRSVELRWLSTASWLLVGILGISSSVAPRRLVAPAPTSALFVVSSLLSLWASSGFNAGLTGVGCVVTDLGLAALPLAAAIVALRNVSFDAARAWTAGIGAGSAGLVALQLHCADGRASHLALFHLLPVLAVGALAVALRRQISTRVFAP